MVRQRIANPLHVGSNPILTSTLLVLVVGCGGTIPPDASASGHDAGGPPIEDSGPALPSCPGG